MYLKITNSEENHNNLQYQDGLIIDPVPFSYKGSCCPGGIYFTTPEYICNFLDYGIYVREITIPEDAEMVQDPQGDKWRASKVILGNRRDLREVDTWKWLIQNGIDIHFYYEYALRYASSNGHLEVVKCLVENGADIHAHNNQSLRCASRKGYLEIVKFLVENGADIHTYYDEALSNSSGNGHLEVVKYLVEKGADIHASGDEALRSASENGHFEVVKYLESLSVV